MRVIENVLVFCDNKTKVFNKQLIPTSIKDRKVIDGKKNGSGNNGGEHANYGKVENIMRTMVNPVNCLDFKSVANAGGHKLHPTQKPVALMEYLIRTYTNEGETVLDNTAGSFTTGVACINTNRRFIGIERDPEYYKTGVKRVFSAYEGQQTLFSCGTTDTGTPSWSVDWPFQDLENPCKGLCDEREC